MEKQRVAALRKFCSPVLRGEAGHVASHETRLLREMQGETASSGDNSCRPDNNFLSSRRKELTRSFAFTFLVGRFQEGEGGRDTSIVNGLQVCPVRCFPGGSDLS